MIRYAYFGICFLALGLGGCAVIHSVGDFLFGTDATGTDKPGPAPLDFLGGAVPWGTAATTALGGLWAAYRSRNGGKALEEVLKVVEVIPAAKDAMKHVLAGKPRAKAIVDGALKGLGYLGKSKNTPAGGASTNASGG
jgi:hypothetical protein